MCIRDRECAEQLPEKEQDYLKAVAIPYFQAVKTWLETIKIGINGNDLYEAVETVLPKEEYGWTLNPGHLCADEEWMSSPIYPQSEETLQSGMLFQIDIIPSVNGYGAVSYTHLAHTNGNRFRHDDAVKREVIVQRGI